MMVAEWGFKCCDGGGVGVYVLGWWQSGGLSVVMVEWLGIIWCKGSVRTILDCIIRLPGNSFGLNN